MHYTVELQQVEPQPIAAIRMRTDSSHLSSVVPALCGEVWNFLVAANVSGRGRHVAIYHDGAMNIEVGTEVSTPFPGNDRVVNSQTPAGLAVTTAHFGSYAKLSEAYAAIEVWCADNRRSLEGPSWEIYGHWTDDPDQLRTDVFQMIRA